MSPHARAPYVTLFETDDNDKIIPNGGRPNVVEIEGAITIEGEPTYCGCWKGRQVDGWWDKW